MLIRSQREFFTGLGLAAIGVASAISAGQRWSTAATASASPALAFGLAAVLTLLGIVLWFTSLTIETEGGEPIGGRGWASALAVAGASAVFAAGVRPLGILLAGMAAAALAAWAVPAGRRRVTAALAAAAVAGVALIVVDGVAGHLSAIWPHAPR